jgi:hypothetical protein
LAGAKKVKGATLNYTMQPFAREFFDGTSAVQLHAANNYMVYFFPKPL